MSSWREAEDRRRATNLDNTKKSKNEKVETKEETFTAGSKIQRCFGDPVCQRFNGGW